MSSRKHRTRFLPTEVLQLQLLYVSTARPSILAEMYDCTEKTVHAFTTKLGLKKIVKADQYRFIKRQFESRIGIRLDDDVYKVIASAAAAEAQKLHAFTQVRLQKVSACEKAIRRNMEVALRQHGADVGDEQPSVPLMSPACAG